MTERLRVISLIARLDITDRRRGGFGSLFAQPAVMLVILVVGVLAPLWEGTRLENRTIDVAISGLPTPGSGAEAIMRGIRGSPEVRVADVASATAEVAEKNADAGIEVSERELSVVVFEARARSRAAGASLRRLITRLDDERTRPPDRDATAAVERIDLSKTVLGGQLTLGRFVPLYATIQLAALIGEASARLRGAKKTRAAEPLHVLPVPRSDLLAGRAVVGLFEGVLRTAVFVGIAVALTFVPTSLASFSFPADVLAVQLGAAALQIASCVAIGSAIGAKVRSDGQENILTLVAGTVPVLMLFGLLLGNIGELPAIVAAIPIAGPAMWTYNAFLGAGTLVMGCIAVASTAITVAVSMWFGTRALDRDGVTLREV